MRVRLEASGWWYTINSMKILCEPEVRSLLAFKKGDVIYAVFTKRKPKWDHWTLAERRWVVGLIDYKWPLLFRATLILREAWVEGYRYVHFEEDVDV